MTNEAMALADALEGHEHLSRPDRLKVAALLRVSPQPSDMRAHKVMTPEEYAAMPLSGWHEVCRDVDGFGGTDIRFLGLSSPVRRTVSIHEYLDDYEFCGEGGDHAPTDHEKELIEDAMEGYIATLSAPTPAPAVTQSPPDVGAPQNTAGMTQTNEALADELDNRIAPQRFAQENLVSRDLCERIAVALRKISNYESVNSGLAIRIKEAIADYRTQEAKKWPDEFMPPETCLAIDDVQNALELLRDTNSQLRHAANHWRKIAALRAAPQPSDVREVGSGWRISNWDGAKSERRILLLWKPLGGISEHVELGKWSSAKQAWTNTYGHPFSGDPDAWSPLQPFLPAPAVTGDVREAFEQCAKIADAVAEGAATPNGQSRARLVAERIRAALSSAPAGGTGKQLGICLDCGINDGDDHAPYCSALASLPKTDPERQRWRDREAILDKKIRHPEAPRTDPEPEKTDQPRWLHKKRGTTYVQVGLARLQTEFPSLHLDDMTVMMVYRSESDGLLWVRSEAEFRDGRFAALQPASATDEK